jgi:hypothetical protein
MNEIVEGAIELMKTKIKDEADERGFRLRSKRLTMKSARSWETLLN